MSFILDALRKSETERQRQTGPGLADAGYRPPARRRGIWLPVLVVVLGANLMLLMALWLKRETVASPDASAPSGPPAVAPAPSPDTAQPVPGSPASAEPEGEFAAVADLPAVEGEPAAASETAETPTEAGGSGAVTTVKDAAPAASAIREDLPTAQQLIADGTLSVPALHLDIHVYGATPADRFAFINMRRYAEGTQLAEGPRIEEITRDGVILNQDGQRFLLTRE